MYNFYSDTQTRPSRAMREAILDAPVGDERHDEDPTTLALCERVADLLGMEAAVFLPSGTMCNEIAIAVHCRPGDEVVCDRVAHVIYAEGGAPAALAGVMMHPLDGPRGMPSLDQVAAALRRPSSFAPRSRLWIAEQTVNLGGGAVWPVERLGEMAAAAARAGLATHLDGARLMNAVVASGVEARRHAAGYDSAWIAFTKGLGCPVGAVLAGSRDFIRDAWVLKRRWGGAMRQTGVLTAMCLYALDHNVDRLADDHRLARRIGAALGDNPLIGAVLPVDTNIVIADLAPPAPDAPALAARLAELGARVIPVGPRRLRIVTHMDVDDAAADALIDAFARLADETG